MTAADQPTTEPSAERDAIVEAVIRGQRRARTYSSQRIGSLRGGASEQELTTWRETWPHRPEREFIDEELDLLAPAPQPAADTERDERLRGILVCSTCDGVGLVGSTPMNSGECPACLDLDRRLLASGVQEEFGLLLAEVARLDAAVTAVRGLHSLHKATRLPGGGYEWSCDECGADLDSDGDTCPTVRAMGLDS